MLNVPPRWGSLVAVCLLMISVQLYINAEYFHSINAHPARWGSMVAVCLLMYSVQLYNNAHPARWGSLVAVCLLMFSVQLYINAHPARWGSLVAVCLLVFSVQLGVQTLPFLLSGELFPTDVRATCKVHCLKIITSLSWCCVRKNITISDVMAGNQWLALFSPSSPRHYEFKQTITIISLALLICFISQRFTQTRRGRTQGKQQSYWFN